jgi:hypothetical protein
VLNDVGFNRLNEVLDRLTQVSQFLTKNEKMKNFWL